MIIIQFSRHAYIAVVIVGGHSDARPGLVHYQSCDWNIELWNVPLEIVQRKGRVAGEYFSCLPCHARHIVLARKYSRLFLGSGRSRIERSVSFRVA